jgi:hypothetical protein
MDRCRWQAWLSSALTTAVTGGIASMIILLNLYLLCATFVAIGAG